MLISLLSALWGTEGLAGLQWVLNSPEAREWVLELTASMLGDPTWLKSCRLTRAKFKPGRKLTTYYDITTDDGNGASMTRSGVMAWRPEFDSAKNDVTPEMTTMSEEANAHGLLAPFTKLVGVSSDLCAQLQVAPLDVEFPQLVRVSDPARARELVNSVYRDSRSALVQEPATAYEVSAIRYRPGQRHVLRYEPVDAVEHDPRTVFTKLYEDAEECTRAFGVASRVADWLAVHGDGLHALRPLGYNTDDSVILYPRLVGVPLSDYFNRPTSELIPYLKNAGSVLRTLHRRPDEIASEVNTTSAQAAGLIDSLKPHSFAKEIKAVNRTCEHIFILLPQVGEQVAQVLGQIQALYDRLPQEEPTFAHGDFKADHLWVTDRGLTLMDFDTCYLADPAIDVGKFLSDLHWWSIGNGRDDIDELREAFLSTYRPGTPSARLQRARAYEALVLVKSTAHRVRLFDSNWAARTNELMERAAQIINRAD